MKRFLVVMFLLFACIPVIAAQNFIGKKILYIDSYHEGYAWSDSITAGIKSIIDTSGATLKIFRMDTKNNTSETFKQEAARKARVLVADWEPDVVITSDDNAAKYFIVPYFNNSELPIVFCGINWDASVYGLPFKNTTGMLEISPIDNLIYTLGKYAKGERIGFLESDTFSARKEVENLKKEFGYEFNERFVEGFDEWKKYFKEFQLSVDILIMGNSVNTIGWNDEEAYQFVLANTEIPTGTNLDWMAKFALVSFMKRASEQGRWAAMAALKILNGTSPSEIPITQNKEGTVALNLSIAKKLGIRFNTMMLKGATIIK